MRVSSAIASFHRVVSCSNQAKSSTMYRQNHRNVKDGRTVKPTRAAERYVRWGFICAMELPHLAHNNISGRKLILSEIHRLMLQRATIARIFILYASPI